MRWSFTCSVLNSAVQTNVACFYAVYANSHTKEFKFTMSENDNTYKLTPFLWWLSERVFRLKKSKLFLPSLLRSYRTTFEFKFTYNVPIIWIIKLFIIVITHRSITMFLKLMYYPVLTLLRSRHFAIIIT